MRWTIAITILAVEKRSVNATLGSRIDLDQVGEITLPGIRYGFTIAGFRLIDRAETDEQIDRIKSNDRPARTGRVGS